MRESKASREQIERRRQLMSDYEEWANQLLVRFRQEKSQRLKLRNGLSQCFLIFFRPSFPCFYLFFVCFFLSDVDTDKIENDADNFEDETIEFLESLEDTIIDE